MLSGRSETCEFQPTTGSCLCRSKAQPWVWPGVLVKECCFWIFLISGCDAVMTPRCCLSLKSPGSPELPVLGSRRKDLCIWSCRDRGATYWGLCFWDVQQYPNLPAWIALLSLHGNAQHAADAAEGLWGRGSKSFGIWMSLWQYLTSGQSVNNHQGSITNYNIFFQKCFVCCLIWACIMYFLDDFSNLFMQSHMCVYINTSYKQFRDVKKFCTFWMFSWKTLRFCLELGGSWSCACTASAVSSASVLINAETSEQELRCVRCVEAADV